MTKLAAYWSGAIQACVIRGVKPAELFKLAQSPGAARNKAPRREDIHTGMARLGFPIGRASQAGQAGDALVDRKQYSTRAGQAEMWA